MKTYYQNLLSKPTIRIYYKSYFKNLPVPGGVGPRGAAGAAPAPAPPHAPPGRSSGPPRDLPALRGATGGCGRRC